MLVALNKILELVNSIEEPEERPEDFNPYDAFSGNMDDAYYGGVNDGREEGYYILVQQIKDIVKQYGQA